MKGLYTIANGIHESANGQQSLSFAAFSLKIVYS